MEDGVDHFGDLRREYATRRYTYEGHGALKLDKTLVLYKSNACSKDTVILKVCRQLSSRIVLSSCYRHFNSNGKICLVALIATAVLLCYFNVLPTCMAYSQRLRLGSRSRSALNLSTKAEPRLAWEPGAKRTRFLQSYETRNSTERRPQPWSSKLGDLLRASIDKAKGVHSAVKKMTSLRTATSSSSVAAETKLSNFPNEAEFRTGEMHPDFKTERLGLGTLERYDIASGTYTGKTVT